MVIAMGSREGSSANRLPDGRDGLTPPIEQRRVWKISEVVAVELVRDIVAKGLEPGDRLPLEAEMIEQYGVSRESIREALRLLETQGIVAIRRGPGGGPVVGRAESSNLARTMSLYFHLVGATYEELFEAWHSMEPMAAELAALQPDRERVERAMRPHLVSVAAGDDRTAYVEHSNELHFSICQLAGNRVLELITRAVGDIIRTHVLLRLDPFAVRDLIDDDHRDIAQAVLSGDGELARQSMAEHHRRLDPIYRAHWQGRLSDLVAWK
jgi:DNA-binding FadR family transcriptional regulator